MSWRRLCPAVILFLLCGCFASLSGPTVISISDLAPPAKSGVDTREPAFNVVIDRFRDERSNRSILGQYDNLGKGGFAGTVTIVADHDVTEIFEDLVKKSFHRKGIQQGPSPFVLRGEIKKVTIGAAPDSQVLRAESFLDLSVINSKTGARLWRKSFLGTATGTDPKTTLALAIQDLSVAVDQDDSILALRQTFLSSGGKLPDSSTTSPSMQAASMKILVSDIDEVPSIPVKQNKNAYAIIIGIEKYRQKLPMADYAVNDAKTVTSYLVKVFGYPEENVITITNDHAAKSDFEKYFDQWLMNNVEKDSTVFVYYSGHGAPNARTGDAYLVPYDGDPAFLEQTGYSLKRLYDTLARLPAKQIIVALDACFSGAGGKSVAAKGSRALVRVDKTTARNIAVLSASGDNQISSSYEEKGHGVFTYYLLKGIKEMLSEDKAGKLELGDLFNYLKPQVERTSRRLFNNEQTPQFLFADEKMRRIGLRNN